MFVLRRISRTNKNLTNYICTSSVIQCDKSEEIYNELQNLFQNKPKVKNHESNPKKKNKNNEPQTSTAFFKPALKSSVKKVAKEFGGDKEMCTDLLNYIKEFEVIETSEQRFNLNAGRKMSKMNFTDSETFQGYSNARLNIFNETIMQETENQVKLKIWDDLEAEELMYMTKMHPKNYFEELIQWTKDGRLWHFPIDNDQGLEEEAETSFTEHIFMERHLEPWCPKKGPLRNFMELVLIGLAKNPYLGVAKKKEHIEWFRNYFEKKKKLLQQLGAMGPKEIESQRSDKP